MKNNPILITGCQRSGTTLLHLILDSHPDIHGIDEMEFSSERLDDYYHHPDFHPNVSFKLPANSHTVASLKTLPKLKILWSVRDPRDVVASMLKLQLDIKDGSVPWSAHPYGASREIDSGAIALRAMLGEELLGLLRQYEPIHHRHPAQRSRSDAVFSAALCWRIKQEQLQLYQAEGLVYHPVSYEQLVVEPRNMIAELLEFVGVGWHDMVLQHHRLHSGMSVGDTDNTQAIDGSNTGKWKDALTAEELSTIAEVCAPAATGLGYQL